MRDLWSETTHTHTHTRTNMQRFRRPALRNTLFPTRQHEFNNQTVCVCVCVCVSDNLLPHLFQNSLNYRHTNVCVRHTEVCLCKHVFLIFASHSPWTHFWLSPQGRRHCFPILLLCVCVCVSGHSYSATSAESHFHSSCCWELVKPPAATATHTHKHSQFYLFLTAGYWADAI